MKPFLAFSLAATVLLAGCAGTLDEEKTQLQADKQRLEAEKQQLSQQVTQLRQDLDAAIPDAGGLVWTFSPYAIHAYNPLVREPVHTIQVNNLTWGDGVVTKDQSKILINEQSKNEVVVLDTKTRQIVKQIPVGQRPVHMYNPHYGSEVWTHADGDGSFYVINTDSLTVTHVVPASLKTPPTGHGKLLWAPELGTKAYATNTGDNVVHVIDLAQHKATTTIKTCQGTHGTSYAQKSGYAYFACGGPRTISVVDPRTDTFVKNFTSVGSQIWPGAHEPILHHQETLMLSGGSSGVKIINAMTNQITGTINATGLGHMEPHHVNGRTLFFTPHNDQPIVYVLDPASATVLRTIYTGAWEPSHAAAQHGTSLAASDQYLFVARETDGIVSVIDMDALQPVHPLLAGKGVGTVLFVKG